jgi:hypothetical protein
MLNATEIQQIVEEDVRVGLGNVFVPTSGFELLEVGEFEFGLGDIRPLDFGDPAQQVSCVAWRYHATHERPLLAAAGQGYNGEPIAVIHPDPPALGQGQNQPAIVGNGQPVVIAGVTLVVTRSDEQEKVPMLLRFIAWSDVFAQLGLPITARPPQRGEEVFNRFEDAPPDIS